MGVWIIGPPQKWLICFGAHTLTPLLLQPCIISTYVMKSQVGFIVGIRVMNSEVRARHARHSGTILPFCHFASFWLGNGTSQTFSNSASFQDLGWNCMMVWCFQVGFGWGGLGTQEMRYLHNPWMPSSQTKPEGRVESQINNMIKNGADWGCGWAKCLVTSVSPECTAQGQSFPRPNPHRRCGAIFRCAGTPRLDFGVVCWK